MTDEVKGKAKGGIARAAKLTPEERKEIAKKAAITRWEQKDPENIQKAEFDGVLKLLNDIEIPCAVLPGGMRVISERGVTKAMGGKRGGAHWRRKKAGGEGADLPVYLSAKNIIPFISEELSMALTNPIPYKSVKGGPVSHGLDATLLPKVCEVLLKARDANKLLPSQYKIGLAADILLRSIAQVGIIALVDEATGYQEIRPRDALQAYLDMIVSKELAAWLKTFPDEFYKNIYALKGWSWNGMSKNRFSVVGKYTIDLVYERIAPGLYEELKSKSPKDKSGNRKHKLFQWLTLDIGHPMLAQHLYSLIMFQRLAISNGYGWNRFVKMIDRVLPKRGNTLELPFPEPVLDL